MNDRREKVLILTASGIALPERISAARAARFEASLAVLSPRVAVRPFFIGCVSPN
jgi:hypothetical protein